ncbi:MAG TPA: hypothetical protein VJ831_02995 [Jatrophihabitantaceae bacterium]|nr:hypothetical protein [Jatrophihabitantaceae bacterium]
MRRRNVIAAVVIALGMLVASTGAANAARPSTDYHSPIVNWMDPVVHYYSDGTAVVHAQYTCWGGNDGVHLFIGLKQGPQVNATTHTSSEFADTFYSTNWNSDQGPNALNCNGRKQNQQFPLQDDPFWAHSGDAPGFHNGTALVQFCLFDSTGDEENGAVFHYTMQKIVLG